MAHQGESSAPVRRAPIVDPSPGRSHQVRPSRPIL